MAMWRSLDSRWGVAAVRVVMGLIFIGSGWNKVAAGFGAVLLLAGGVLLFFAGAGRLSLDEVWLERRRG